MDLNQLFTDYTDSAFRLETLPVYNVSGEQKALAFFNAHGILPDGHNKAWVSEIRHNVASGKTMKRLRLLTLPLTMYEQFELATYKTNREAGEQIRVLNHSEFKPVQDFWAFDNEWIARMIYDDTGAWHGAEVSKMTDEDRTMVNKWFELWEKAPDVRSSHTEPAT